VQGLDSNANPAARIVPRDAGSRTLFLAIAIFVIALIPLFSTPVLPFIDLYNHLARYFVLAHVGDSALLQQYYAANWKLLPNIGLDVINSLLMQVLPPADAAHVTVIGIFAVQYTGVLYFNRALTGRLSLLVALLLVPLLYSFVLNWGFANFQFGLGLVFWGAGWWLRRRDRIAVALPVACVFAVVIFFVHGLTFALYGILLGALEIGLWWQQPDRRTVDLLRAMLPLAVQAVAPAILFMMTATVASADGVTNADESVARLSRQGQLSARLWDLLCYRLSTILRVAEGPSLWFDALSLLCVVGILVMLQRRGRLHIAPVAWPAILIAAVLVVVTPPTLFGVGYVADRMPLFGALLLVGALVTRFRNDRFERNWLGALALIVVVRLVAIAVGWQTYTHEFAEFETVAARLPPGAMTVALVPSNNRLYEAGPRCQMYGPLLISTHGQIGPLFANADQQPLRLVGKLRQAFDALPINTGKAHTNPQYYDNIAAAAGPAGFDYLLVCNIELLTRPLPRGYAEVARTTHFVLFKLH
jgi:hypothetical protein